MVRKTVIASMAFGVFASVHAYTPKLNAAGEELRLIKTSDADNGTWYTEREKLDLFISTPSCAHFMDITETQVCVHRLTNPKVVEQLLTLA
jgi:leucyl aminopeptidase